MSPTVHVTFPLKSRISHSSLKNFPRFDFMDWLPKYTPLKIMHYHKTSVIAPLIPSIKLFPPFLFRDKAFYLNGVLVLVWNNVFLHLVYICRLNLISTFPTIWAKFHKICRSVEGRPVSSSPVLSFFVVLFCFS